MGSKFVLLKLKDSDPNYGTLTEVLLENPDMAKLNHLQYMLNERVISNNEFTDQGWDSVTEYIHNNFKVVSFAKKELIW